MKTTKSDVKIFLMGLISGYTLQMKRLVNQKIQQQKLFKMKCQKLKGLKIQESISELCGNFWSYQKWQKNMFEEMVTKC